MRTSKNKGFTLLEVLVAFTIMALSYVTLMKIISGSANNAVQASGNTKMALLAQSKMDELGLFEVLEEGETSGEFDENTQWQLSILPYEVPYEGDISQQFSLVELMEVNLTITRIGRGKDRSYQFSTLRAVTPNTTRSR